MPRTQPTDPPNEPLRLGFARGIAPAKWAKRWALAVPDRPLELVPLTVSGELPHGEAEVDVSLVRVVPGQQPDQGQDGAIHAVRLYTEAVALVVDAEHVLADHESLTLDELNDALESGEARLLDHPGHAAAWPEPQAWNDPAYAPSDALAALELTATGLGTILLPLPFARHLSDKKQHRLVPVRGGLPGTAVWATWSVERDAADVQQLVGILRGRTARSSRLAGDAGAEETGEPGPKRANAKKRAKARASGLAKNSRGAQLAAARPKQKRRKR